MPRMLPTSTDVTIEVKAKLPSEVVGALGQPVAQHELQALERDGGRVPRAGVKCRPPPGASP